MAVLTKADRNTLLKLSNPQEARVLTFDERHALRAALVYIQELEDEKSWESPYRQAISVLENAERSFMGAFT